MAYFAKINNDSKVEQVISVNNNVLLDENNVEQEQKGIDFLNDLLGESNWKQTSYNTIHGQYYSTNAETGERTLHSDQSKAFRGNFAGIDYTYDSENDVFYPSQPYPSWTISGPDWQWQPPFAMPIDGNYYEWNEENQSWDIIPPL